MEEVQELKQHQHHSKLAIFAVVGFLAVITLVVIVISKSLQSERAYQTNSQASETNSSTSEESKSTGLQNQISQFLKEYKNNRSAKRSLEEVGIDTQTVEKNTMTSPQGCRYAVFPGEFGGTGLFECKQQCTADEIAQGKCGFACYIHAVVICFNPTLETFKLFGSCKSKVDWDNIGQGLCCDYDQLKQQEWWDGDMAICDAICQRAEGKNCEIGYNSSQLVPSWRCPFTPSPAPTSGGGQPLPIEPLQTTF